MAKTAPSKKSPPKMPSNKPEDLKTKSLFEYTTKTKVKAMPKEDSLTHIDLITTALVGDLNQETPEVREDIISLLFWVCMKAYYTTEIFSFFNAGEVFRIIVDPYASDESLTANLPGPYSLKDVIKEASIMHRKAKTDEVKKRLARITRLAKAEVVS